MFNTLLVEPLFNLLAFIFAVIPGNDFGLAVIILTILVRLLLWPIVNKQLHSQKVMQKLTPAVAKIREQSKGDKQKESRLLMELYKEKGVNPLASFIPLLVQLPLFIALFVVLRDIIKPGEIERLSYDFVKGLGAIKVIVQDNGTFHPTLFGLINLAESKNIPLAAVAGLTQYFQSKQLTPQHPDPQQKTMFKVTTAVFPALTVAIAYTLPAALALYWATTSLVAIVQQQIVLGRDVEELEERADKKGKK